MFPCVSSAAQLLLKCQGFGGGVMGDPAVAEAVKMGKDS